MKSVFEPRAVGHREAAPTPRKMAINTLFVWIIWPAVSPGDHRGDGAIQPVRRASDAKAPWQRYRSIDFGENPDPTHLIRDEP